MSFHSVVTAYAAFAAAAGVLVITPGVDTALVVRTAASAGVRRAAMVAAGTCCGVLLWGGIVAAGLGPLLDTSVVAYTLLRWIGAAYLLYLGLRMLVRPRQTFDVSASAAVDLHGRQARTVNSFLRGLLSNVLNPKIGVFYVTFLPQFVPAHVHTRAFIVSLAGIQAVEGALWFGLMLSMMRPLLQQLRKPAIVRGLDRITGAVLVSFGVKLALSER